MELNPINIVRNLVDAIKSRLAESPAHQPVHYCNIMALLRHLCDFDEAKVEWVLRWIAYPLRNPGAKMDVALVINGDPGTGKRLLFEQVVAKLYDGAAHVQSPRLPLATFSNWPTGTRLAVVHGVFSKWNAARLKDLAAAKSLPPAAGAARRKNRTNIVFLSDSRDFLPILDSDPRLFVVEAPPPMSRAFYDAIAWEIKNGGLEAFREYLMLRLPMGKFNEHTRPPGSPLARALEVA